MLTRLDVEFLIAKSIISGVHLVFRPPLDRRRKISWYWKDRSINSGSVGHPYFLDTEIERRGINTGTGGVPKDFKTKQVNIDLIDLRAHELFSTLL